MTYLGVALGPRAIISLANSFYNTPPNLPAKIIYQAVH